MTEQFTTIKSFKYRIYPTKSQISNMENQFSMCRHLYNWCLKERIDSYQKGTPVYYYTQAMRLPEIKKERPWFKSVHSQVIQQVLKRLDKSYQNFFRRIKKGEAKAGFPKFKKRGQWNSLNYPQYNKLPSKEIKVPKVGTIKLKLHRQIPKDSKIKTLIITKDAGKWFACFSIEVPYFNEELKQVPKYLPPLGIDMGLIDFIYDSNGNKVSAPKYLRKAEVKLKRLQRRFSKTTKGTKKRAKLLLALQKLHYRIKCKRLDFLHKTANKLLNETNLIIHEDLKVSNMMCRPKPKQDKDGKYLPNGASAKSNLNKSIADVGWSAFFQILDYKAFSLGKKRLAVPPYYTSQKCSKCGKLVNKSLSTRTHSCDHCGFTANRDHNAALNILRIGMDTFSTSI